MVLFERISRFGNRSEAAYELADALRHYRYSNALVLAIPRGGVPIGAVIARELNLPLDIVLSKKIGHPNNPEYAIGSVSLHGLRLHRSDVPIEYIMEEAARLRTLLRKRYTMYRGSRQPVDVRDRIVIIVDDGVATGSTILATIDALRENHPQRIVVAVPVAAPEALAAVKAKADETVCLLMPEHFYAVGQFYDEFPQVDDEEVIRLLRP